MVDPQLTQPSQYLPRKNEREYYDDDDFISNSSLSAGLMSDYSQSDMFDSNSIRSSSNHFKDFRSSSSNSFHSDDTSSNFQSDDFKSNSIYSAETRSNIKSCSLDSICFQSDDDSVSSTRSVGSEEDNISIGATRNDNEGNPPHINYIHYNSNIKHVDIIENTQVEDVAPNIQLQSGNLRSIEWTELLPGQSVDHVVTALYPYDLRCISTHGKTYKYDDIHPSDLQSVDLDLESTFTFQNARVIPQESDVDNVPAQTTDCWSENTNDYKIHPTDVSVSQASDLEGGTVTPTSANEVQRFISTSVYSHGTRECSISQRNSRRKSITSSSIPSLRHTKGITPNTTSSQIVTPGSHTHPQTSNNNSSHSVTSSCISLEGVTTNSSSPDFSKPINTSPHNSMPSNTSPHNSMPSNTSPHNSMPSCTSPHTSMPSSTSPHISKPSNTSPHNSMPSSSFPHNSMPSSSSPHNSKPSNTSPHNSKPSSSSPHNSKPSSSSPHNSKPSNTSPHNNKPSSSSPHNSKPSNTYPHNSMPSSSSPHNSKPSNTSPHNNKPSSSSPHNSKPSNTSPHNSMPRCTPPHISRSRSKSSRDVGSRNTYPQIITSRSIHPKDSTANRMYSQDGIHSSTLPKEMKSSSRYQNRASSNSMSLPRTASRNSLNTHSNGSSETTISYVVNSAEFEVKYFVISHSSSPSSTELHTDRKSPYALEPDAALHVPPRTECSIFKLCADANRKETDYASPYNIGSGDYGRVTETFIPFCGSAKVSTTGTTEKEIVYIDYTQPFNLKHASSKVHSNVAITPAVTSSCGEVSLYPKRRTSKDKLDNAGRSLPYRNTTRSPYNRCSGDDAVSEETHHENDKTEYRDYVSENVVIVKPVQVSTNESYFNGLMDTHAASCLERPPHGLDKTKNSRSRGSNSSDSVSDKYVHHPLMPRETGAGIQANHTQDFLGEALTRRDSLVVGHEANTPCNYSHKCTSIHVNTTIPRHGTSTGNRSDFNARVGKARYSPVSESPDVDPLVTSSSIDQLYVECQRFVEESERRVTLTELEKYDDDTARTTNSFDHKEMVLDSSTQEKSAWMNKMIEQFESSRHAYSKVRSSTGARPQASTRSVLEELYPTGHLHPEYNLNCILILPQSSLGLNNSNNSVLCLDSRSLLQLVKHAKSTSSGRKKRTNQHVHTVNPSPSRHARHYVEKARMNTKIDCLDYRDINPTATEPRIVIKKENQPTREVTLPKETAYGIRDHQPRHNVTSALSRIRTMMRKKTIKRRYITRISGLNEGMLVDLEAGKGTFEHGCDQTNASLSHSPESDRRVSPPRNSNYSSRCSRVSRISEMCVPGRGRSLVFCQERGCAAADVVEESTLFAVSASLARQALITGMEQIRTELWGQMFKHNLQSAVFEIQRTPIVNAYNEQSSILAQCAIEEAIADCYLELAFHEQQTQREITVSDGYNVKMSAKTMRKNKRRISSHAR